MRLFYVTYTTVSVFQSLMFDDDVTQIGPKFLVPFQEEQASRQRISCSLQMLHNGTSASSQRWFRVFLVMPSASGWPIDRFRVERIKEEDSNIFLFPYR